MVLVVVDVAGEEVVAGVSKTRSQSNQMFSGFGLSRCRVHRLAGKFHLQDQASRRPVQDQTRDIFGLRLRHGAQVMGMVTGAVVGVVAEEDAVAGAWSFLMSDRSRHLQPYCHWHLQGPRDQATGLLPETSSTLRLQHGAQAVGMVAGVAGAGCNRSHSTRQLKPQ